MSADPFVQFPESGQSLNRYSYVMNNPLSYTDQSGFGIFETIVDFLVGAFVGGPILGVINAAAGIVNKILQNQFVSTIFQVAVCTIGQAVCAAAATVTAANGGGFGDILKSAALSYGTAEAFGAVQGTEYLNKVVSHGIIGGVSTELSGGSFLSGFASAGATAGFDVLGGYDALGVAGPNAAGLSSGDYIQNVMVAATVGGLAATLGGGKFANGAVTASFAYAVSTGTQKLFDRSGEITPGSEGTAEGRLATFEQVKGEYSLNDSEIEFRDSYGVADLRTDEVRSFSNLTAARSYAGFAPGSRGLIGGYTQHDRIYIYRTGVIPFNGTKVGISSATFSLSAVDQARFVIGHERGHVRGLGSESLANKEGLRSCQSVGGCGGL